MFTCLITSKHQEIVKRNLTLAFCGTMPRGYLAQITNHTPLKMSQQYKNIYKPIIQKENLARL